MKPSIDRWAGTGFQDYASSDGKIRLREIPRGEISRMTSAEFWHLDKEFEGRSIFFGSGIQPFIDPDGRFLILRDAGIILLFDYSDGKAWHAESPWNHQPGIVQFPEIEFTPEAILIGRFRFKVPKDRLETFFIRGLGRSEDGFLSHWRPEPGQENSFSGDLCGKSVLIGMENG